MSGHRVVFKSIYYGWVVVLSVFLIAAVVWGAQYSFGVFFTHFQDTFNWSRATISLASTFQTIVNALIMIPAIRAIDSSNKRLVLSSAAFLFGFRFLLCSHISNLWQLYLYFGLITGVGCGIFFPALITIVSRWFTDKRGLALGIASAGVGVGTFAVPPVAQYLISEYGWRDTFTILGIASFVVLIVCVQFIKHEPLHDSGLKKPDVEYKISEKNTQVETKRRTVAQVFKTREIYLILVATVFVFFAVNSIMIHLDFLFQRCQLAIMAFVC
jgi:MFS family permease